MREVKEKRESVLYAFDLHGNRVFINDALRDVEYRCPGCNCIVTPRNNDFEGRKKIKYYAHKGDVCKEYRESMLHILSKEILMEEKAVMLPGYKGLIPHRIACLTNVHEEVWDEEIRRRPDIVAQLEDGTEIFLEIKNTHEVDDIKAKDLKNNNKTCLEIDVSCQEINKDTLKEFITNNFEGRRWVNAPLLEDEYKKTLAANGPIYKFLEEYGDMNDSFFRSSVLHLLKNHFTKSSSTFLFGVTQNESCEFAEDCKLSNTACKGTVRELFVDFSAKYGCPSVEEYIDKEGLRLSFEDKSCSRKFVFFIGFKPCKVEKLKDRAYVRLNNIQEIKALLKGKLGVTSPNVNIGDQFPRTTTKVSPFCRHPLFVIYGNGTVVAREGEVVDNGFTKRGRAWLRMDNGSLSLLHSKLGYDAKANISLQKLGLHLANSHGLVIKNCMLCTYRRKSFSFDSPSKCTKLGIPLPGKNHSLAFVCESYKENTSISNRIKNVLPELKYHWVENPRITMNVAKTELKEILGVIGSMRESGLESPVAKSAVPQHSSINMKKTSLLSVFEDGTFKMEYEVDLSIVQKREGTVFQLVLRYNDAENDIILAKSLNYCFENRLPIDKCGYCNHVGEGFCNRMGDKRMCPRFSLNNDLSTLLFWHNKDVIIESITQVYL